MTEGVFNEERQVAVLCKPSSYSAAFPVNFGMGQTNADTTRAGGGGAEQRPDLQARRSHQHFQIMGISQVRGELVWVRMGMSREWRLTMPLSSQFHVRCRVEANRIRGKHGRSMVDVM